MGSFLSAIAATIAAVLAAINLHVTGRREQNRWAREVLVDVFVTFLNAGFESGGACNRLIESIGIEGEQDGSGHWKTIATAHRTETEMLTKMRLLAAPAVVNAAVNLHAATHAYVDIVQRNPTRVPEDEGNAAKKNVWQMRYLFLAAAKSEIGLEPNISTARHGTTP